MIIKTIKSIIVLIGCVFITIVPSVMGSLIDAVERGDVETIRELVKRKECLNETNDIGWTALHFAILCGNEEIVELLVVAMKADLDTANISGDTPLNLAVRLGTPSMAELLIKMKANAELADTEGIGPLHVAVYRNGWGSVQTGRHTLLKDSLDMVGLLLKHNVERNKTTNDGKTALHLAVAQGSIAMVKLLRKFEVDRNILDNDRRTPLQLARHLEYQEIAKFLSLKRVKKTRMVRRRKIKPTP